MGVFKKPDGKWVIQFMHKGKTHTCYSLEGSKKGFPNAPRPSNTSRISGKPSWLP